MDLVEVLHLEAVSVFGDERLVVVWRERGPGVDGGVVDANLDVVSAGPEVGADGEPERRMPERAGALTVDEDDGGFSDGRVVPGTHSRAGVRRGGRGERRAAFDFEECWSGRQGIEVEVALVDAHSGVEAGGRVDGPVGEGAFMD